MEVPRERNTYQKLNSYSNASHIALVQTETLRLCKGSVFQQGVLTRKIRPFSHTHTRRA